MCWWFRCSIFFVFLIVYLGHCNFTVKPARIVTEVGADVSFSCVSDSGSDLVIWTLPNGYRMLPGNVSPDGRFKNDNGSLFIFGVALPDSGSYYCSSCPDTSCVGTLKAYIMPSYTLDFSLICGINIVLLILFTIIVVINHLRYRSKGLKKGLIESVIDFN